MVAFVSETAQLVKFRDVEEHFGSLRWLHTAASYIGIDKHNEDSSIPIPHASSVLTIWTAAANYNASGGDLRRC